jgi:Ca2+-binding RTX toxin-like protein
MPLTLNLGAGDDNVSLGLTNPGLPPSFYFNSTVTVNGQGGSDAIVLNNTDSGLNSNIALAYTITATDVTIGTRKVLAYDSAESLEVNAGTGSDTIHIANTLAATPVVVRAGAGDDVIRLGASDTSALLGAVSLDGEAGADTLDYSAYLVPVRVNLSMGTATGVALLDGIDNVVGGQGDDILVGHGRENVLRGGLGRDILIGGAGADTLFGGVDSFSNEGGDDILIGDGTAYDLMPDSLEDVMREWSRTDLIGTPQQQYHTRINHLLGVVPGGLNGATVLDLLQVTSDGDPDFLDGGDNPSVTELDWFFASAGDTVLLQTGERVN